MIKKVYLLIMLHVCWTLEDIYDICYGYSHRSFNKFYPSAKYEDALYLLNKPKSKNYNE